MNLQEIKTKIGVERIPFAKADAEYPEWRSYFDTPIRVQYVISTALFARLSSGEAVDLFLNTTEEVSATSNKPFTKHLIGEQVDVDYL